MQQTLWASLFRSTQSIGFVLYISIGASLVYAAEAHQNIHQQPRYAPGVVSIIKENHYLRTHNAPIYWKISSYYLPQPTDASCALASATMLINVLRIPQMQYANQKLATTDSVMQSIHPKWEKNQKQGGDGITLDQFGSFLNEAMKAFYVGPIKIEIVHATNAKAIAIKFHQALLDGEKTGRTFIIVNFDEKFISGTESVGHFAPVGAYDADKKQVLIMDPDRLLFEPYWVSASRLLKSMETEDSDAHKNRGFIIVK